MARTKKRSPRSNLTRLVQTHVTPEVGDMLAAKAAELRIREAQLVRQLLEIHLGLLPKES